MLGVLVLTCSRTLANLLQSPMQVLQHAWTYKPLVQDVLGLSLNRVTVDAEPTPGQQLLQHNPPSKQTFEARNHSHSFCCSLHCGADETARFLIADTFTSIY